MSSDLSGKATSCTLTTTMLYEVWTIPMLFPFLVHNAFEPGGNTASHDSGRISRADVSFRLHTKLPSLV